MRPIERVGEHLVEGMMPKPQAENIGDPREVEEGGSSEEECTSLKALQ